MLTGHSEVLFEMLDRRKESAKRAATEEVIKLNQLFREWKMLKAEGILPRDATFIEYIERFL